MWTNVRLVLGISAGIAINLLPDLIAALRERAAVIDAILTLNAGKMVSPLFVSALTGRRVYSDGLSADAGWEVPHINLVKDAAAFVAAPATANLVGKLANGIADDLVTTAFVACRAPRLVCPAMHPDMWSDPILRDNVARLRQHGVTVVDPAFGTCSTGETGIGALAGPDTIVRAIEQALGFDS
jgi:phosphopantothenoylcysteine decarboxylase/phosphopantothenate--cysteine ligase